MIRLFSNTLILILSLYIVGCGGKNDPDPDQTVDDISYAEMLNMVPDSTELIESEKFYVLEKSVDDIKSEIKILQARVVEYGYQQSETDYSKKLKEFIDRPPPAHKIFLKNIIYDSIDECQSVCPNEPLEITTTASPDGTGEYFSMYCAGNN